MCAAMSNQMISPSVPCSAPWIIAVTGASGTVYARRLLQILLESIPGVEIELVFSEAGLRVMREEEGISAGVSSVKLKKLLGFDSSQVRIHNNRDIGASIASGSYPVSGMVIVPCSMRTLAAVSAGMAENLIHRAADVTLKEGRRLILVPRETPLSAIHLENMLRLSRLGVRILPAMPGFYHQPQSIQDLVDMMVMRIADQMGFQIDLSARWKADAPHWPMHEVPRQHNKIEKSNIG